MGNPNSHFLQKLREVGHPPMGVHERHIRRNAALIEIACAWRTHVWRFPRCCSISPETDSQKCLGKQSFEFQVSSFRALRRRNARDFEASDAIPFRYLKEGTHVAVTCGCRVSR